MLEKFLIYMKHRRQLIYYWKIQKKRQKEK